MLESDSVSSHGSAHDALLQPEASSELARTEIAFGCSFTVFVPWHHRRAQHSPAVLAACADRKLVTLMQQQQLSGRCLMVLLLQEYLHLRGRRGCDRDAVPEHRIVPTLGGELRHPNPTRRLLLPHRHHTTKRHNFNPRKVGGPYCAAEYEARLATTAGSCTCGRCPTPRTSWRCCKISPTGSWESCSCRAYVQLVLRHPIHHRHHHQQSSLSNRIFGRSTAVLCK